MQLGLASTLLWGFLFFWFMFFVFFPQFSLSLILSKCIDPSWSVHALSPHQSLPRHSIYQIQDSHKTRPLPQGARRDFTESFLWISQYTGLNMPGQAFGLHTRFIERREVRKGWSFMRPLERQCPSIGTTTLQNTTVFAPPMHNTQALVPISKPS